MKILVIDVGGTHVKVLATGRKTPIKIKSGSTLTPRRMVAAVKRVTEGWHYDAVSIGYPGAVMHGRPVHEPYNLGPGWVGFDFQRAFGKPVKVINDAAMQALGSYRGGRMLFLGLGTGLGSALVVDGIVEPTELAHLPYKKGRTYEESKGRPLYVISELDNLTVPGGGIPRAAVLIDSGLAMTINQEREPVSRFNSTDRYASARR